MVVEECKFPHVPFFLEESSRKKKIKTKCRKCSRMVIGKHRTAGSPGLLPQLCKLFRDSLPSTEINETLY